jgi:hypothetical protein
MPWCRADARNVCIASAEARISGAEKACVYAGSPCAATMASILPQFIQFNLLMLE